MAKVIVGVKRCIDYRMKIRVRPDKKGVVTEGVKHSMNPFDEVAVEEGIVLKEKNFAREVIVVSCGPKSCRETLRTALAMGATSGIHVFVPEDVYEGIQPYHVSKMMATVAEREKADLLIFGKQAIDDDANQTAQMTAALLDWPQATFCSKIEAVGKSLTATREVDEGLEKYRIDLPAVISADLRLNTPRYVTLPNMMKAKKVRLKELNACDLGVDLEPKIEVLSVECPSERISGSMVTDVDELLAKLRNLKILK